jgi:shikimate kinase
MWNGGSVMKPESNIVITGFMGTGKSTAGQLVAAQLNRPFLDTDAEIEKRVGKRVAQIFADDGEAAFRHIERRMCRFLAAQEGYVISTGGGMLVDEGNREVMLSSGLVVCLSATPEILLQRLQADKAERPLLRGDWRGLLEKRRPAYEAIPCQIDTTGKTAEAVATEIIALWNNSLSA